MTKFKVSIMSEGKRGNRPIYPIPTKDFIATSEEEIKNILTDDITPDIIRIEIQELQDDETPSGWNWSAMSVFASNDFNITGTRPPPAWNGNRGRLDSWNEGRVSKQNLYRSFQAYHVYIRRFMGRGGKRRRTIHRRRGRHTKRNRR